MTPELQNKVINILDTLSAKLGVASGYFWEMMIKQVYISAISDIIFAILAVVNILLLVKFIKYGSEKIEGDYSKRPRWYYDEWMKWICCFWISGSTLITLFAIIGVFDVATKLINPEYWALQQILKQLSNL